MDHTILGRTGLRVSVMGLGCGGHSRLGLGTGKDEESAVGIVRRALDLGVTFLDTAESYGTETAVGKGIAGRPRESFVLSTKAAVKWQGRLATAADMRERIEASLRRLGVDFVDVFHRHAVALDEYDHVLSEIVPELVRMRDAGLIRFVGITERFVSDPQHAMLRRALRDDWFDVAMVGFSILNQSARERVFAEAAPRGIGTLCMFAVRRALSDPVALREMMADLVSRGLLDADDVSPDDPLGFLIADGVAASIPEAAYRFCRHEPPLDVVLSGTGDPAHLDQNARSIMGPPLPEAVAEWLRRAFARVDCVSGN
ncbi:MAG: aldo/keto reductase [Armatimonadetes bacterium]|nr:aldo/keto reductase [Armatimonadota bacterium]